MRVLNLGCGMKTSPHPHVVNVDWSPYLRIRRNRALYGLASRVLDEPRRERLANLPSNILVHDLARGIPFEDGSVDAVYHSHLLEHLDRDLIKGFLVEALRVLRPGGVHRIVVPDLEFLSRRYLENLEQAAEGDHDARREHDEFVAAMYEQAVRKQPLADSKLGRVRRTVERAVLGDARKRGETHQWMWDRVNLGSALEAAGFGRVGTFAFDSSSIPQWEAYGLDRSEDGEEFRPGSLYQEGTRG